MNKDFKGVRRSKRSKLAIVAISSELEKIALKGDAYLQMARMAHAQGDLTRAINHYEESIELKDLVHRFYSIMEFYGV